MWKRNVSRQHAACRERSSLLSCNRACVDQSVRCEHSKFTTTGFVTLLISYLRNPTHQVLSAAATQAGTCHLGTVLANGESFLMHLRAHDRVSPLPQKNRDRPIPECGRGPRFDTRPLTSPQKITYSNFCLIPDELEISTISSW
jgi:hypothetical protein